MQQDDFYARSDLNLSLVDRGIACIRVGEAVNRPWLQALQYMMYGLAWAFSFATPVPEQRLDRIYKCLWQRPEIVCAIWRSSLHQACRCPTVRAAMEPIRLQGEVSVKG